ncbi:uncharacterized protein LOC125855767 [Solanum stenotomum]|uniref:uncharacterized protein LOC125855767 n=1 Tax=Solanum stenotomum TaxID=172797 RepID=UPI0020D16274|nr:uncharacterized protein LOC125855767 [Solanum stenotomum]
MGGPIMKKTPKEAIEIVNELAEDANQWVVENSERKETVGVHQVDTYTTLLAHIASIAKDVKQLTLAQAQMTQSITCDFCAGRNPTHECQQRSFTEEEVNVVGNFNKGNYQEANNFNAMGQRHPRFSWSSPNGSLNVWQQNNISERLPGNLPSDTLRNPKELKVMTLRSGKKLNDNCKSKACEVTKSQDEKQGSKKVVRKSNEIQKGKEKSELEIDSKYMPTLPFFQKMKREKLDKYFGKFLEMLKQLHVNIPFTEVITQMPAYAKFFKEVLSSKRKLEETSVVKLNAHCSAFLQNKLRQKCGDLGSFTIPCALGTARFEKSLCDSGESINLLPLSIFKKLEESSES